MTMHRSVATMVVTGSDEGGHVDVRAPEQVAATAAAQLGTREDIETEIDAMLSECIGFYRLEPDQVMRLCAALSARCTELYIHLHRVEGRHREYKMIRTQQINPLLGELERQYKVASRQVEIRRQDLALM